VPKALTSQVEIGTSKDVPTNDWAAKLYNSLILYLLNTLSIEEMSLKSIYSNIIFCSMPK
jgi:hypothetical protein